MKKRYLHEHADFEDICRAAREQVKASLQIVEKDYWVMHVIWSLSQCGFQFELKGGTSLSKGWEVIHRFSEDVDIHIHPPEDLKVYAGKNHDKPKHRESRNRFFDWLADSTQVAGARQITRDPEWDDRKNRNCGIRVEYDSRYSAEPAIKPFVLLEAGFAQVEPNEPLTISSWVMDIALDAGLDVIDNRAAGVKCYLPEYTFVEKLSAISRKFQQEQAEKILPGNFIRHYYDLYKLLGEDRVQEFIGTSHYDQLKSLRFSDEDLGSNEAFLLSDRETRARYEREYQEKAAMYYRDRPEFSEIMSRIRESLANL